MSIISLKFIPRIIDGGLGSERTGPGVGSCACSASPRHSPRRGRPSTDHGGHQTLTYRLPLSRSLFAILENGTPSLFSPKAGTSSTMPLPSMAATKPKPFSTCWMIRHDRHYSNGTRWPCCSPPFCACLSNAAGDRENGARKAKGPPHM